MTSRHRFSLKFRLIASLFIVSAIGIASAVYFAYREIYNTDEVIAERTLQGQANEFLEIDFVRPRNRRGQHQAA